MEITNFKIKKLHGHKDVDLKFKNNTLILVGNNGAGKTTVLRILFYFVTGQWSSLKQFEFDSISLVTPQNKIIVKSDSIKSPINKAKILKYFPLRVRASVSRVLDEDGGITLSKLDYLSSKHGIRLNSLLKEMDMQGELDLFDDDLNLTKLHEKLKKTLGDTQVIYLPTYRRIEQELSTIFKDLDEDDFKRRNRREYLLKRRQRNYLELVEFGMKDVEKSIEDTLEDLKEFARESLNSLTLAYLGDVVERKYDTVDVEQIIEATDDTIRNILNRIDENILLAASKERLLETINNVKNKKTPDLHSKVICHYFTKLLNFQQELEKKEENIRKFCEVCNSYMMEDKVFVYTSSSFSFKILPKNTIKNNEAHGVDLHDLSSGEKQIVSLFSHLYLSDNKNFFVMIDEPELSLSVPWQRQFLVDINNGSFCSGLLAVTHSPFIYDNKLEKYTHGLGEFMTSGK